MELWKPQVPENLQHPNFKRIVSEARLAGERGVIDKWADGFVDRDGKFEKEFQTTFNSSFWELYLFACFKELGLSVDFSVQSPDFALTGKANFVAEAVIAAHPEGFAPEWEIGPKLLDRQLTSSEIEKLLVLATIRLSNALSSKLQKYRDHYAKLPHVQGRPFVICVAPFEQPLFFLQNDNALRRVLFAYDRPIYWDDEKGVRHVVGESRKSTVRKPIGTALTLGLFKDAGASEISALIFSNTATYGKVRALADNKKAMLVFNAVRYNAQGNDRIVIACQKSDYKETLLDGLHVCLNPFARVPFDPALFEDREVTIHHFDPKTGDYTPDSPDGFLIQRSCMEILPVDQLSGPPSEMKSYPEYKSPDTQLWKEGELIPVEGEVSVYTDQHMAHYKGWTMLLVLDTVDDDWMGQALKGLYCCIADFVSANQNAPDDDYLILPSSSPDLKTAFEVLAKAIDEVQK